MHSLGGCADHIDVLVSLCIGRAAQPAVWVHKECLETLLQAAAKLAPIARKIAAATAAFEAAVACEDSNPLFRTRVVYVELPVLIATVRKRAS
jgi:hypothetical protein